MFGDLLENLLGLVLIYGFVVCAETRPRMGLSRCKGSLMYASVFVPDQALMGYVYVLCETYLKVCFVYGVVTDEKWVFFFFLLSVIYVPGG